MKSPSNKLQNVEFKLSANELLFIPKHYDPTSLRPPTTQNPNDFVRKRKYMEKIKDKGPNEQRQLRAKQDTRYLPRKSNELSLLKTNDERMFCVDHLNGRCKAVDCDKYHQLRNPRLFGVCKYYLAGCCRDGDSCPYMHEEFPCRYYYLNIPHPKTMKLNECRFKHGGPLPPQLCRYFKKQLEEWVKKLTIEQTQQFDSVLIGYADKFDEKQIQLKQEYGVEDSRVASKSILNEQFSFEHILSVDQIKALAEMNITNAVQINQIPVDVLIDRCGLTMDQIYKITINTCNESKQTVVDQEAIASNSLSINELTSNDSSSSTEIVEDSFEGFCDIELNNAVEELQCKKVIADEEKTVNTTADLNVNERNLNKINNIDNSEADCSDDSNDSDDEFNLLIDEDVQ